MPLTLDQLPDDMAALKVRIPGKVTACSGAW
jgi:hypothetical protein